MMKRCCEKRIPRGGTDKGPKVRSSLPVQRTQRKDSRARPQRVLEDLGRSLECILMRNHWNALSRVTPEFTYH